MSRTWQNYYELLQVPRNATEQEIDRAYGARVSENNLDVNQKHPYPEVIPAVEQRLQLIHARNVLTDPQRRAWYDQFLDVLHRVQIPATSRTPPEPTKKSLPGAAYPVKFRPPPIKRWHRTV